MTESSPKVASVAGRHPEPVNGSSQPVQFVRRAIGFAAIGAMIYAGLYGVSENLIHRYAHRNRFFMVRTAPRIGYDYVILGASHAVAFDRRDMNARLEDMTGRTILNLATDGAGVTINQLLLDYFLVEHRTGAVVYVLDSFGFYSRAWNEERLSDTRLFHRAPWDPALARLLLTTPAGLPVAFDYITGFSKINNPDRFELDLHQHEGSLFERVYRPIEQIDRRRIAYLYPDRIDAESLRESPYLARLEEWIGELRSRGVRFLIVRPPIPGRVKSMIPNEETFGRILRELATGHGIALHDFSGVSNREEFFFDTDHLNQEGVIRFFEDHLAGVLAARGEDN